MLTKAMGDIFSLIGLNRTILSLVHVISSLSLPTKFLRKYNFIANIIIPFFKYVELYTLRFVTKCRILQSPFLILLNWTTKEDTFTRYKD